MKIPDNIYTSFHGHQVTIFYQFGAKTEHFHTSSCFSIILICGASFVTCNIPCFIWDSGQNRWVLQGRSEGVKIWHGGTFWSVTLMSCACNSDVNQELVESCWVNFCKKVVWKFRNEIEGKQLDLREMTCKCGRWMKIIRSCADSQIFST
jgi:hypothetical protein